MTAFLSTQDFLAVGGKMWTSRTGEQRVYFNDVAARAGLEVYRRSSRGWIMSATLHGQPISNGDANFFAQRYGDAKVWYDVQAAKFCAKGLNEDEMTRIVKSIRADVAALATTEA